MFYKTKLKDTARVPPHLFGTDIKESIVKQLKEKYEAYISKELGIVIDVLQVEKFSEGILISGDGAAFYEVEFEVLTFKIDLQEVFVGKILDIAEFGAFITLGPIEGMIHISQTMDDFVSFGKDKVLQGKESNKALRVNDICRTRVIAVSYKDITNPKFGLTMRQPGLGKVEWIIEAAAPKAAPAAKGKA
ncbi:MAG: DNA-directed RNA polymerase subunit E' [Candidatus Woesearchaeota archaeon]|jgi:DNA-directed RNA polymerase subunit E'